MRSKYININGTEKMTIIHLNESTPPINMSSEGCMTNKNAKISLSFPELSILELFIEAAARIYDVESYVVLKNIMQIIPKAINNG